MTPKSVEVHWQDVVVPEDVVKIILSHRSIMSYYIVHLTSIRYKTPLNDHPRQDNRKLLT